MTRFPSRSLLIAGLAAALSLASGAVLAQDSDATYVASIHAMNSNVTGSEAAGEARLVVNGDQLTITVNMHGTPGDTIHWQHFHGFKTGEAASCPQPGADANGDGIVDLIETHGASGHTMVPFDANPAAMDVAHGDYPKANADGSYSYTQTVSLSELQTSFSTAFDGQQLDLGKRVIYIHGVPADTALPDSVASLGPIPAQVTIPIACGAFEKL